MQLRQFIARSIPESLYHNLVRVSQLPYRLRTSLRYSLKPLQYIPSWLLESIEVANFTYDLTDRNKQHLASFISVSTNIDIKKINKYIHEVSTDKKLQRHLLTNGMNYPYYGRRIGWYALVRALKPKIIVETGVDRGLGSCILVSAIIKNKKEGFPGHYYGTDINPSAGVLFTSPYSKHGTILYGDSIQSLRKLNKKINLFINDSDHSPNYEQREYRTIKNKLHKKSFIIGDNSHNTSKLQKFAHSTKRKFIFWQEKPKNHWYPGAGIGLAYF